MKSILNLKNKIYTKDKEKNKDVNNLKFIEKTFMIRKLSELINNGESKMKILNIHERKTDE